MKIKIAEKEEAYSYDELEFIEKCVVSSINKDKKEDSAAKEKIETLKKLLEKDKENSALFFMPENTFSIFSMFQGNSEAVIEFDCDAAVKLVSAVRESKIKTEGFDLKSHAEKKLEVLEEFLKKGNSVCPSCIKYDNFLEVEI